VVAPGNDDDSGAQSDARESQTLGQPLNLFKISVRMARRDARKRREVTTENVFIDWFDRIVLSRR